MRFREVPGWPGYLACDDGSIWSNKRNTKNAPQVNGWHRLNPVPDRDGYLTVKLSENGRDKMARVNIVILQAFCGDPPEGMPNPTAAHDNGIKADNRLENLQWKSQRDNCADKKRHGTHLEGERHPRAILTEAIVVEVRRLRATGMTWREIADRVERPFHAVKSAGLGKAWKGVAADVS